jgi:DNA-binding MarR family transcriptional regulator
MSIKKLTEKELLQQTEEQVKFLTTIYPNLVEDTFQECCIEIRPIKRLKDLEYTRSLNIWRLDNKGIEQLLDFNKKVNGKEFCVYYSSFALNYDIKSEGYQIGKVNNENARYTTILPLDFDEQSLTEITKQLDILRSLDIEFITVFTGNGIQALILLNKKVYDTKILKKWTTLLISKGFRVDDSIVDCARVLRLPYTFNCKQFDINNKKYSHDAIEIATEVWEWTEKRYDILDIFNKIQTLPSIIPSTKEEIEELKELETVKKVEFEENSIKDISTNKKKEKINEIFEVVKSDIEVVKDQYKYINIKQIPDAVVNMLYKTPEGLRNDTLLFLVPYLRNTLKLSEKQVIETIKVWGSRCTTPYTSDFAEDEAKRILNYKSQYKYGKYTDNMQKAFGPLEIHIYKKNNTVEIYNDIFDNGGIIKISDAAFKIYLHLELNKDKKESYTIKEIEELTSIPSVTIRRNIKDLIRYGYIRRKTTYKKNKESYLYSLSEYRSRATGVTIFNKATLKLMLMDLTDGEIKLYAYLYRMLNEKLEVTASQKYLSSKIGKSQPRISCMTTELGEKDYLNKTTLRYKGDKLPHCIYNIGI